MPQVAAFGDRQTDRQTRANESGEDEEEQEEVEDVCEEEWDVATTRQKQRKPDKGT
jgi:hypothetical protein